MPKNHLKAQFAPRTWPISKKSVTFTTRPNPSGHSQELIIPINIILRDLIQKARTNKEVKKILHDQEVLVNGKRRKDYRYPVGLLDVISIPLVDEHYTLLINTHNKLYVKQLDKKEAAFKLSKIVSKKTLKKGQVQLNMFDGENLLVKKDEYKTGTTIVLSLPKKEIKESLELKKGNLVYLFKGTHVGKVASVVELQDGVLKFKHGSEEFETKRQYAIVIGKDKPVINIK